MNAGTLTGNTSWTQTSVPYLIPCGDVTVPTGATLTIGAGVILKLLNNGTCASRLVVNGGLVANGTAQQKIYFTSQKDDTLGGDSNGDGAASTPGQGDWGSIFFNNGATGSVSNAVIRYGGSNYDPHVYGLNETGALEIQTGSAHCDRDDHSSYDVLCTPRRTRNYPHPQGARRAVRRG